MALIQSFCLRILQDPDGQISACSPVTLALNPNSDAHRGFRLLGCSSIVIFFKMSSLELRVPSAERRRLCS